MRLLKHLRIVFDNTNDVFIAGKYDQYMPVGLLVVHTVTLCHRYNENRFDENDQRLHHALLNAEYLNMAKVFFHLIRYEKLTLIDQRKQTPISHKDIKKVINGYFRNERDDYLSLFLRHVAFDEYIQTFKNTRGISSRDPKIIAAMHIKADIMDQRRLLKTELNHNQILYNSIKDHDTSDAESINACTAQEAREEMLLELLADLNLSVPADMRDSDYDSPLLLWEQLSKRFPKVFPKDMENNEEITAFFDRQILCAFTEERLSSLLLIRP
ncbi:hypothetical protein [Marinicella sp. W31]|uniref:hypothetical protein n=1 Tax=Marinicella sp. W31 TaxID=3023713 RepID=UPI003756B8BB